MEGLERDVAECRQLALQRRVEEAPRGQAPTDEVFPQAALRLVHGRGDAVGERGPEEPRVDLPLVQPVAELVQTRQKAVDVVLVEASRQADVVDRHRHLERMDRVVEAPRLVVHPPRLDDRERHSPLRRPREGAVQARVVDRFVVGDGADHRHEAFLEPVEDRLHLGRLHARLVVVEHDVVGIAIVVEARDVAPPQLEVPLEVREHDRVVVLGPRTQPCAIAERAGALELRQQLGRNSDRLLVVASGDADHARLERVGVVRLLERSQLLDQLAEGRVDTMLVRDGLDRRALLGARVRTGRRHLRLLVPAEQRACSDEIVDRPEPTKKLVEPAVRAQSSPGWTRTNNPPVTGRGDCVR